MKRNVNASTLPSLKEPLKILGRNVRAARQARGWTIDEAALRVIVSPSTFKRIEAGDPKVAMGYWAAALSIFQLFDGAVRATLPENDRIGQAINANKQVKRVRQSKSEDEKYDF